MRTRFATRHILPSYLHRYESACVYTAILRVASTVPPGSQRCSSTYPSAYARDAIGLAAAVECLVVVAVAGLHCGLTSAVLVSARAQGLPATLRAVAS